MRSPVAPNSDAVVHDLTASPEPRPEGAPERRGSGRRARARDRLLDRPTRTHAPTAALLGVVDLDTMLLFVDDDLRETALALQQIESYLVRAHDVLTQGSLRRADVLAVAADGQVIEHVDQLGETLESLRRRLAKLAGRMK